MNVEPTENVNKAAGAPSALNVRLGNLIEKFNGDVEISIKLDQPITLAAIFNKRQEVSDAIKRLKHADKMLIDIHAEYTLSLERA